MSALTTPAALPELAAVPWRPRASEDSIRRRGVVWTAYTIAHVVPFLVAGIVLVALDPIAIPVALACIAHAWIIPELYASRGANVIRRKRVRSAAPERVAQGLLGDLLGHDARELQRETGLAMENGSLGVWLVGEAGALLLTPGGKRVHCFCVAATDPAELPPSDRIAHLLLALRTDETGFATVANHAFAGAPWRLRRRLKPEARIALAAARQAARETA
ncbi:MAG: hypothetical protein QOF55_161 [Thermoleophilaceae bacterium]|jgi:hypothetical protein|nr:hypothetical protein [Thermoleophilaceae bacterium]